MGGTLRAWRRGRPERRPQRATWGSACAPPCCLLRFSCVPREAAEKAGQHTEAALMGALPMVVPDFKNVVMPAIVVALDEWKRDAEKSEWPLVARGAAGMA